MNFMTEKKFGKLNYCDILALLCLLCCAVFFVMRCPLSFGYEDESFYLSIPYRLTLGDSLISDEWHVSQLSAFLLYVPVKLYVMLKGSTEGIVLFFRYLFIVVQSGISATVYIKLREKGVFAIAAATVFFLHIPMYYMSLNYNSMGLIFVLLTGLFMYKNKNENKAMFYLSGLFFACSVLCNPILIFVFAIYVVLALIFKIKKEKKTSFYNNIEYCFKGKSALYFIIGTVSMAVIFFAFLLMRSSFDEIIQNLPMIFTDPEYSFSGKGQNIISLGKSLLSLFFASPIGILIFMVILVVIISDKNRFKNRKTYLIISAVAYLIFIVWIFIPSSSTKFTSTENRLYQTFPLAVFGLICYILSKNKNKPMFTFLWLFGVIYSACLDVSSDLGSICSVLGLGITDVASVIFAWELINEIKSENDEIKDSKSALLAVLSIATVIILQVCAEIYVDIDYKALSSEYLVEDRKVGFTQTVDVGPLKGLKTTEKRDSIYDDTIKDLSSIKSSDAKNVFIVSDRPWCYLYTEKNYASFSSYTLDWFITNLYRLPEYYKLHPDKMPDYIYVSDYTNRFYLEDTENSEKILDDIREKYDCSVTVGEAGYIVSINH